MELEVECDRTDVTGDVACEAERLVDFAVGQLHFELDAGVVG